MTISYSRPDESRDLRSFLTAEIPIYIGTGKQQKSGAQLLDLSCDNLLSHALFPATIYCRQIFRHSRTSRRHSRAGGNPKYQRSLHKFYLTDIFVLDSWTSFALAMQLNFWIPACAGMTAGWMQELKLKKRANSVQ